jgi:hypothetical protein
MKKLTGPKLRQKRQTQRTLTVGDVAMICEVSTYTVQKWCNTGLLPCYRLPGKDRRIGVADMRTFLRDNLMPERWLDEYLCNGGTNATASGRDK